jgi:hypothetical protein
MKLMSVHESSHGGSPARTDSTATRGARASASACIRLLLLASIVLAPFGCYNPPVDVSQLPAPLRFRLRKGEELSGRYEDEVTGGQLFTMYCGYCHNMRAVGERPFSNYQNVAAHMRVRALMTGEEQAKIEAFFRRWHDVPPASGPVEPSPKREVFSQPIPELREDSQAQDKAAASAKAEADLMPAPLAPSPAANAPGIGGGLPPAIP